MGPEADREITVLLIEDDAAVAEMYRIKLETDGYVVRPAPDGETGLRMARDLQPDLVYLDVRMSGLDGFAVLEQMRTDPGLSALPVIMLSNFSEPELIERGLNLGARDYLIKAETTPADLSAHAQRWRDQEAVGARSA
jgi:DNA-binding response OmpR family regulator